MKAAEAVAHPPPTPTQNGLGVQPTHRYRLRSYVLTICDPGPRTLADSPEISARTLRAIFFDLDADQEHFVVLALDTKHRMNGYKVIGSGTLTSSLVHPREVFRAGILLGSASVIVAHNHPSGDPTPSEEDLALTRRLEECGSLLGIPLADHIILGEGEQYASLKGMGLMQGPDRMEVLV